MFRSALYLIFFFFKQKTAYEMRISDWSSDVCSSDLERRVAMLEIGLAHYLTVSAILFTLGIFGIFLNRKNVIIILMSIELMLLAVNLNLEIGRASCRERVCQYV